MWETVEAEAGKIGMAKTKRGRGKGRSRKEERAEKQRKKQRREKLVEIKRLTEEWKIWDEAEEAAKSEAEAKKLVPE